jgi:hypothetical protein
MLRSRIAAAILAACGLPGTAFGQVLVGVELLVDAPTGFLAAAPSVSIEPSGLFVVAWHAGFDEYTEVYARAYTAWGVAEGPRFQVNTFEDDSQLEPAVSHAGSGASVVVWGSTDHFEDDRIPDRIRGQRITLGGAFDGAELGVATSGDDSLGCQDVSHAPSGGFAVAWSARGATSEVRVRRYDSDGTPLAAAVTVGTGFCPQLSHASDGRFVVTWARSAGSDIDVFARVYDPNGTPLAGEFQVHTNALERQLRPHASHAADGSFVVAWDAHAWGSFHSDILARRFSATGAPLGGEIPVSVHSESWKLAGGVAHDGKGGFVVVWASRYQDGDGMGVYLRRFSEAGAPLSPEIRVNTLTAGDQHGPSLAARAGEIVVAWTNSVNGVFTVADVRAQRLTLNTVAEPTSVPALGTSGLLLLAVLLALSLSPCGSTRAIRPRGAGTD